MIKQQITELTKKLNYHAYRYYVLDDPEIPDTDYDKLFVQLQKLEHQYPQFTLSDSPTQRVGGKTLSEFKQVKHFLPMLSLSNAFSEQDIIDFDQRIQGFLYIIFFDHR